MVNLNASLLHHFLDLAVGCLAAPTADEIGLTLAEGKGLLSELARLVLQI